MLQKVTNGLSMSQSGQDGFWRGGGAVSGEDWPPGAPCTLSKLAAPAICAGCKAPCCPRAGALPAFA